MALSLPTSEHHTWNGWTKFLFRFLFAYFLLYLLPFPLTTFPYLDENLTFHDDLWKKLIPWVGEHILKLAEPISVFPNGSGDTTFNYVQILIMANLALVLALIWSVIDRHRPSYERLFLVLHTLCRFYLGYVMLQYGFVKVIKTQFSSPSLYRLIEPYGDSSPMGLLWTFMGYSEGYNLFVGLGEVMGGFLLFFRRSMALGALILVAVMSNVVVLNFCYDVPVKLYSLHLLAMAFVVLIPYYKGLVAYFFAKQNAEQPTLSPFFSTQKGKLAVLIIKGVFLAYSLYAVIDSVLEGQKKWGSKAPKSYLYGLYEVDTHIQNQDTLAPLLTDTLRWRRVLVEYTDFARFQHMDDSFENFTFKVDSSTQQVEMYPRGDSAQSRLWDFRLHQDTLYLEGRLPQDTVQLTLIRKDLQEYRLINRGFNWINEYPYNR